MHTAAEFFAGIGLMRSGLDAAGIDVVWANDSSPVKQRVYEANYGPDEFRRDDVRNVDGRELPQVDLATASWPCIDVSLAGKRAGLDGTHSSLFFEFARILEEMGDRRPTVVLLENVPGLVSANGGSDLRRVLAELNRQGYACDPVIIDAAWFVPQSRPRLFVVGTQRSTPTQHAPAGGPLRPASLCSFIATNLKRLRFATRSVAAPAKSNTTLDEIIDDFSRHDPRWWSEAEMDDFRSKLAPAHQRFLRAAQLPLVDEGSWRTIHHRTRDGQLRWEVRMDRIAGCLTAARGGSNRRALMRTGADGVRCRWITGRECARLQGVAESFDLAGLSEDQARICFGDAVCVPAVTWLAREFVLPALATPIVGSHHRQDSESRTGSRSS